MSKKNVPAPIEVWLNKEDKANLQIMALNSARSMTKEATMAVLNHINGEAHVIIKEVTKGNVQPQE